MGRPTHERYRIQPLARRHDRAGFHCGVEALDRYLQRQAGQDARRNVASVFVAEEDGSGAIHGFYTLSMAAVVLDQLPPALQVKMPRYPTVPAVRLGRLAVAEDARGTGLGAHLLMDAMARSLASEIAWAAFVVDAKDDQARSFYAKYGFQSLLDGANHLFLPRKTLAPLLFVRRADGTAVVEPETVDVRSLEGMLEGKVKRTLTVEEMNEAIEAEVVASMRSASSRRIWSGDQAQVRGMDIIDIDEATRHLSDLLDRVETGEEITLGRAGQPVARLVPIRPRKRVPGTWAGAIEIADDFDDSLPDDELAPLDP